MIKKITFMVFIAVFLPTTIWAGNGSFLILKSVYLHSSADRVGKKRITKRKAAYDVEDIYLDAADGSIMFKLNIPFLTQEIKSSGFILKDDSELQNPETKKVRVYSKLPTLETDLGDYHLAPPQKLLFTGKKEISPDFPNIVWREVNYKIRVPKKMWAAEWAGVYRPDKKADWLNKTYHRALSLGLRGGKLQKVLQGLVEVGFSKNLVLLSLDKPQKILPKQGNLEEWIYPDRKIVLKNNLVQRIL